MWLYWGSFLADKRMMRGNLLASAERRLAYIMISFGYTATSPLVRFDVARCYLWMSSSAKKVAAATKILGLITWRGGNNHHANGLDKARRAVKRHSILIFVGAT